MSVQHIIHGIDVGNAGNQIEHTARQGNLGRFAPSKQMSSCTDH